MSEQLEPCPLCNAEAIRDDLYNEIICCSAGCDVSAIPEEWNRRPAEDALAAALAAARAEVARLRDALECIADDNVPVTEWDRQNRCPHRRSAYEPCAACSRDYARAALNQAPAEGARDE